MKRGIVALIAALATILSSQGEIIYVNGPSFQIPAFFGSQSVDFDGDGATECGFASGGMLCTADIPISACVLPFYVGSGAASQLIVAGSDASVLPLDTWISSDPLFGANWSDPNSSANLVTYHSSPRNGTAEWIGPLAAEGVGCLGVRFQATDGLHYGWIRVRMPQATIATNGFPLELVPVVVDWAYETTPNTPVKTGQTDDAISFIANFTGANEVPPNKSTHSGSGSFELESYVDGFILSYHLELDDAFQPTSAGIFGPATPGMNARFLLANLGAYSISNFPPPTLIPLNLRSRQPSPVLPPFPGVLIYDGQIALSSNQVAELLAGQLYVNFKSAKFRQGELRGEILATAPIQFYATLSGRNGIHRNPRNASTLRGEATFTLTGNNLICEVAMDVNFAWTGLGIYASPSTSPFNLTAKLDTTFGIMVPAGGLPNAPGLPGQVLYSDNLTLTDKQVSQIKRGEFYINVLTSRFRNGEIGGRILPAE